MRVGLDVMGGDYAPEATVSGAILAQKELQPSDQIILIGDEDIILDNLNKKDADLSRFEIVHAPDVISMEDHPTRAFIRKSKSSIAIGFKLLKAKKIHAFAGAGNSGAMMVGSIYSVNNIQGIIRPCTTAIIPKQNGDVGIILDVGTNPDSKPDVLYQFALLGSTFASNVYNIRNPKVGLLNIGEEATKGSLLSQSAYQLMKGTADFNFVGNVEGRDFFGSKADVIVCDGFTGNIALKLLEEVYFIMKKRGLTDDYFERFNYENFGGTPILGINSPVIVGHGISNANAIKNMILLSKNVYDARLTQKIKRALYKYSRKNNS